MKTIVKTKVNERLYSLDTLRGFDMLWIIGGGAVIHALAEATQWGWVEAWSHQLHHASWEGFHLEDLIFPLFMFISGVAIPYALTSRLEKGTKQSTLVRKVFKRMLLLVIFGIIYNGALKNGFNDLRYASVLAQIGIAYFFAALIVIYNHSLKARVFWLIGILVVIAAVQLLVNIPDFGSGVLTRTGSVNAWIDQHFLPGRLYGKTYDPEGLLCIVSATSVTLMGTFAGNILRNASVSQNKKAGYLLIAGLSLTLIALSLSPFYPIIKKIWTVPFNLLAAGLSFLHLAVFYYIIDVKKWRKWIFFFQVIGLNSITIYMGVRIIGFESISEFFLGWIAKPAELYGAVIIALGAIAVEWSLLYYLYKNKIFLRV